MTPQDLDEKLRTFNPEEFQNFNNDYGGGQKTVEERVREFVDNPIHERRLCQLLGLKTENEKLTDSTIKSADAAVKSASSAKLSMVFSAIAGCAALLTIFFDLYSTYHQYDDLQATILNASPSFGTLFTGDIVFTNNGNRQCSVAVVNLMESHTDNIDYKSPRTAEFIIPFSSQPSFTLKPSDVISKQFTISGKGRIMESGFMSVEKGEPREWKLSFCVIDSKGKYHIIKVPVLWAIQGEENYRVTKYPLVVKLLPSPVVKEFSMALPLLRPPDR